MTARPPAKRKGRKAGEAGRRLTGLYLDMLAAERGAGRNTLEAYARDLDDLADHLAAGGATIAMTPPIIPEGHAVWKRAPIAATIAMYTATTAPLAAV